MRPTLLAVAASLAHSASALLVASGSFCSQYCGNTLSNTTGTDMTCTDTGYSSAAGIVFESCIGCELTSNYTTTDSSGANQTDLQWLLYNLRYATSYCVFGQPNNVDFEDNPCLTSTACGPLKESLQWDNFTHDTGAFDYCEVWNSEEYVKCDDCLSAGIGMNYLGNFMTILDAACSQTPTAGNTVSIQGSPFSTTSVNITTPTPSSSYTFSVDKGPVSLGGKVGIAIGSIAFLLAVAGFTIVCLGRRKRRAYLRSLEGKYGNQGGFPSPNNGFPHHDMMETPMSQKPLRGWDDNSPVSAATDRSDPTPFQRYFSPYSSHYSSPVSAADATSYPWPTAGIIPADVGPTGQAGHVPAQYGSGTASSSASPSDAGPSSSVAGRGENASFAARVWPSYTQEDVERMAHEQQLAQIGLAMGGSTPSLRSKNSNPNVVYAAQDGSYTAQTAETAHMAQAQAHAQALAQAQAQAAFEAAATTGVASSAQLKGKGRGDSVESYELHHIQNNPESYTPPQQFQETAIQHAPRRQVVNYPRPPSPIPYDGLTEDDARAGRAI